MASDKKYVWVPMGTFTPIALPKSTWSAPGFLEKIKEEAAKWKAGDSFADAEGTYTATAGEAAKGSTTETTSAEFEKEKAAWSISETDDTEAKTVWEDKQRLSDANDPYKPRAPEVAEGSATDTLFVDPGEDLYDPATGEAAKGSKTETVFEDAAEGKNKNKVADVLKDTNPDDDFKLTDDATESNFSVKPPQEETAPKAVTEWDDEEEEEATEGSLSLGNDFVPPEKTERTDIKPPDEVAPNYSFSGFSTAPKTAAAAERGSTSSSTTVMKILFPGPVYPDVTYNFIVLLGTAPFGDFKEVSDFGYEVDPYKYKEGGRNTSQRMLAFDEPGKYKTLKLKWGTVRWNALYDWMNVVQVGGQFRRSVTLMQLSRNGNSISRVVILSDAWPVSWTGTPMDSHSNEVGLEELELAYEKMAIALPAALTSSNALVAAGAAASVAGQAATALLSLATGLHPKAGLGKFASFLPEVSFSINPESLELSRSTEIKEDGFGDSSPAMLFDGGKFDDLSFSVLLDESEFLTLGGSALSPAGAAGALAQLSPIPIPAFRDASILTVYDKILALMKPKLDTANAAVRPCLVKFTWGDLVFVGAIESADLDIKLWDQNGKPRRGTVKVKMKGRYKWDGTSEAAFFPSVDATAS